VPGEHLLVAMIAQVKVQLVIFRCAKITPRKARLRLVPKD
jgi:hypothetical protein